MLTRFLLVILVAAAALAGLDRVPALFEGATHRARLYRNVGDAEVALGAPVWLPAYYPDTLSWPPDRIEALGDPPVVAVRVADRAKARERLVLCQSITGAAMRPADLGQFLETGDEASAAEVQVDGRKGRLVRLVTRDGRVVHDLYWSLGGRNLTMRYDGELEDLLRMAASTGRAER